MKTKARYLDLDPSSEHEVGLTESPFAGEVPWHGIKHRAVLDASDGGDYIKLSKQMHYAGAWHAPSALLSAAREPSVLEERFKSLASEWERETVFMSSTHQIVMHPAYQSIIGLGVPAVPLILRKLAERPNQWFWALHHITGASPADDNSSVTEAAAAWHQWGLESGFFR